MAKDILTLADLTSDPRNARKHNPRNVGMIEKALGAVGAARSIVVDEDGVVLAGNATIEAAAAAGIDRVQVVDADGQTIIAVRRSGLTLQQKIDLAMYDNRSAELADWDTQVLADLGAELDLSAFWTRDELAALLQQELESPEPEKTIVGQSDGYDFRDIHPGKLAYRVEAAWRAESALAVDLYSGEGQLAAWYQRRFDQVVRVDARVREGIDYRGSAAAYLRSAFSAVMNTFAFLDFDDEGSPLREVKLLFRLLPIHRTDPFVLCLTDGSGLNLKLRGKLDPKLYGLDGPLRQATLDDYTDLEDLVSCAVQRFANDAGWAAHQWSSVRGSAGNVVYQTFRITRAGGPNA